MGLYIQITYLGWWLATTISKKNKETSSLWWWNKKFMQEYHQPSQFLSIYKIPCFNISKEKLKKKKVYKQ